MVDITLSVSIYFENHSWMGSKEVGAVAVPRDGESIFLDELDMDQDDDGALIHWENRSGVLRPVVQVLASGPCHTIEEYEAAKQKLKLAGFIGEDRP